MNPILADIYSTILPSAPYIIAAYALLWVPCSCTCFMVFRGTRRRRRSSRFWRRLSPTQQAKAARRRTSSDSRPVPHLLRAGRIPSGDWPLLCSAI